MTPLSDSSIDALIGPMNELAPVAVSNGCLNQQGPREAAATPVLTSESLSVAKNIPTADQIPSDLSSTKKSVDANTDAQSPTSNKVADKIESPNVGPSNISHSISSDVPAVVPVPPAANAPAVTDHVRAEASSKSTTATDKGGELSVEVGKAEKGKPPKEKSSKHEAKLSKRKSAEKSKSKSKKSRESSAMDGESTSSVIDAVSSGKVNGRSGNVKEKRDRKRKQSETSDAEAEPRSGKRVRLPHTPFQHPAAQQIPQFYKNCSSHHKNSSKDSADDKIVVFSRGDFLAVRNDSDSFYICRTTQNVYKTSRKFKIQWLQNEKNKDIYQLDFLDQTDFECVLTNLRLTRKSKVDYELPPDEKQRVLNILQRAINVERGVTDVPDLKQVAADGIDVSVVGKKEEKEFLEIEAHSKKESPPVEPSKVKVSPAEVTTKSPRVRKMSTESSRSSRKSETSQKENAKKRERPVVEIKKEVRSEKSKKKELREKPAVEAKSKKLREKRSTSSTSNVQTSAKSKDQVLVEKIVGEIVKKHKIQCDEKEKKKQKPGKESRDEKEEHHRSSRLTRNTAVPPAASALTKPPPPHHETIRGLVNLLNSFSSNSLRSSTLLLLERLASDYSKDCLPFLVETLLTGHRTFLENDDGCESSSRIHLLLCDMLLLLFSLFSRGGSVLPAPSFERISTKVEITQVPVPNVFPPEDAECKIWN